jgi:hypothetical protein
VRRLRKIGAVNTTLISQYRDRNGRYKDITNTTALSFLRNFIKYIDSCYGLSHNDIGLHSLRSSSAMAMYISGVPICTIMLIGRWRSNAFMRYIQPQVSHFSNNVSRSMVTYQTYYHFPSSGTEDPNSQKPLSANAISEMDEGDAANGEQRCFTVWT